MTRDVSIRGMQTWLYYLRNFITTVTIAPRCPERWRTGYACMPHTAYCWRRHRGRWEWPSYLYKYTQCPYDVILRYPRLIDGYMNRTFQTLAHFSEFSNIFNHTIDMFWRNLHLRWTYSVIVLRSQDLRLVDRAVKGMAMSMNSLFSFNSSI